MGPSQAFEQVPMIVIEGEQDLQQRLAGSRVPVRWAAGNVCRSLIWSKRHSGSARVRLSGAPERPPGGSSGFRHDSP